MVDPNIWGKHGWKFLHYVAQGFPHNPSYDEKKMYKDFFTNIQNILPCYKCQQHYKQHLQNNPITDTILESKENLENWVINIHNQVNQNNQKSILSFDQARNHIIKDDCQDNIKPSYQDDIKSKPKTIIKEKIVPQIEYVEKSNTHYIVFICILIAINIFLFIKK